jgi:hypothetical protein
MRFWTVLEERRVVMKNFLKRAKSSSKSACDNLTVSPPSKKLPSILLNLS